MCRHRDTHLFGDCQPLAADKLLGAQKQGNIAPQLPAHRGCQMAVQGQGFRQYPLLCRG